MASHDGLDSSDDEVVVLRSSGSSTAGAKESGQTSEDHAKFNDATTIPVDETQYEAGMCCEVCDADKRRPGHQPKTDHFALVAHRDYYSCQRIPGEPNIPLAVNVQSPILQDVLREAFKDYPDVRGDTQAAVKGFECSPLVLFHCWNNLLKILGETEDPTIERHITLLVDLFKPEFEDAFNAKNACHQTLEIPWKHVWTVFPRGSLAYSQSHATEKTIQKVNDIRHTSLDEESSGQSGWQIEGDMVAFNGREFGKCKTKSIIPKNGTLDLINGPIVPLTFHPDRTAIMKRLKQRGEHLQEISKQPVWGYWGKPEGFFAGQSDVFREKVMISSFTPPTMLLTEPP